MVGLMHVLLLRFYMTKPAKWELGPFWVCLFIPKAFFCMTLHVRSWHVSAFKRPVIFRVNKKRTFQDMSGNWRAVRRQPGKGRNFQCHTFKGWKLNCIFNMSSMQSISGVLSTFDIFYIQIIWSSASYWIIWKVFCIFLDKDCFPVAHFE